MFFSGCLLVNGIVGPADLPVLKAKTWVVSNNILRPLGLIHTGRVTRRARKLEHFSFDVTSVQCENSH